MSHPDIHFIFTNNEEEVYNLPATMIDNRIAQIFGQSFYDGLVYIREELNDIMLEGYICQPENGRGNKKLLEYIHTNKTAKMFRCAAVMGAICGGAEKKQLSRLSEYGLKIGLGFQIADDILDVNASSKQLGKTAGKDAKAAKCTYPAVVGIEKAIELEKKLANEAVAVFGAIRRKSRYAAETGDGFIGKNKVIKKSES